MATNPMQRKARNSFLLGMLLTLVITGLVIVLLILQLKNYKEKEAQEQANSVTIYVLKQDVISGQVITTDMLNKQVVDKTLVPSNAIGNTTILSNYSLTDKEGNEVITEYKNNTATLYLSRNGSRYELKEEDTGNYYIERNSNKEYIELAETPIIAKIDMKTNTVITTNSIAKSNEKTTDDLRKQEYNVIQLPTQIQTGEYVDVRLAMPSGQDYIVVSKKQVEIPQINGIDMEDTVWLKMTEGEIITMNNAIVDTYRMAGAKLYITPYVEAGVQTAAIPTYVPTESVANLINSNPNIVQTAKNELIARYNANAATVRNGAINPAINGNPEGEENLKTKVEESVTNSREGRKQYLQSLGADY